MPVEQVAGETAQYLHHDQQGSTRLLTGASGTVAGTTTFDAYGNKLGSTGSATSTFGYDGQHTSSDVGLIYLRARAYDPATGQFLTVDPLLEATHEPYVYAGDDPLQYKDRRGLGLEEVFEDAGIPCPWCSSAEGAAEALEGVYHAARHGSNGLAISLAPKKLTVLLHSDDERLVETGVWIASELGAGAGPIIRDLLPRQVKRDVEPPAAIRAGLTQGRIPPDIVYRARKMEAR